MARSLAARTRIPQRPRVAARLVRGHHRILVISAKTAAASPVASREPKVDDDPIGKRADAAAFLLLLAGEAVWRDGRVEAIRALMVAKRTACPERIQTINQARALVLTGPDDIRIRFGRHATDALVAELAALRPPARQHDLAVAPDSRGRGIGRKLVSAIVERARETLATGAAVRTTEAARPLMHRPPANGGSGRSGGRCVPPA